MKAETKAILKELINKFSAFSDEEKETLIFTIQEEVRQEECRAKAREIFLRIFSN
jgi:hypothetical protein